VRAHTRKHCPPPPPPQIPATRNAAFEADPRNHLWVARGNCFVFPKQNGGIVLFFPNFIVFPPFPNFIVFPPLLWVARGKNNWGGKQNQKPALSVHKRYLTPVFLSLIFFL